MKKTSLQDWLSRIEQLHPNNIELGLDRVTKVFARLTSEPESAKIITIAGTNGKGSTVECLTRCLLMQGFSVATYTSPHLIRFNERVVINGKQVDDNDLIAAFEAVDSARGEIELTYFEFTTLAAFWLFAKAQVDYWVLEVGLGGRLDAVNVMDADVAVITSIGLDHLDWLGDTREKIAVEKCGIIKPGCQAVCSDPSPPVNVAELAAAQGSQLAQIGVDFAWVETHKHEHASNGNEYNWKSQLSERQNIRLPSTGSADNFAGALAALEALGVLPEAQEINQVFEHWQLPGRQQIINGPVTWWLDVAHNADSAQLLANALQKTSVDGQTIFVLGMLADKAVGEVLKILSPCTSQWILVELDSPRAISVDDLTKLLPENDAQPSMSVASVAAGCAMAQARANPGDRIVVTGSFHSVGPALAWLGL